MFMFLFWQPEWMWRLGWLATLRLEAAGLAASWGRGGGDDDGEDYHRDCVITEVMTSWHLDDKTTLKEQTLQREERVGQESWFLDDKIDDDTDDKDDKDDKYDKYDKDQKVDKHDKDILTREFGPEIYWNLSFILSSPKSKIKII